MLVRAFNVLRQYEEADVPGIWRLVQDRLAPGGLFIDGTCDEIGRRVTWIALDAERPLSLSMSMRFGSFDLPSDVAERLPKALIHRNVPGEPVHRLMQAMDRAWLESAPLASFGNRQRWQAHVQGTARRRVAGSGRAVAVAPGRTDGGLGGCGAGGPAGVTRGRRAVLRLPPRPASLTAGRTSAR